MTRNLASRQDKMQRRVLILTAALSLLVCGGEGPAFAQMMMRSPNINIQSRIPSLAVPRMDPSLAGRGMVGVATGNSLRIRPDCGGGYCMGQPVVSTDGRSSGKSKGRGNATDGVVNTQAVANEIVAEIDGTLSEVQADALARRHGLRRVESQSLSLLGSTLALFRLTSRRTLEATSRELAADRSVRSVQPNFRYALQDQDAQLSEGDPAQYALAKLRLPQAHTLAHGANVTVAVIDSGVDLRHPEFSGTAIISFDALSSKEGPHAHGTGVAGAIVSHSRLMGSAPAARILAIRAFGAAAKGAESTSYILLKALNYAAAQGAQIVNMSFAGPKDALIARALSALGARGVVLVAAAGNAGPKSPPLYPGADANVIAVSATDAQDRLFAASNRGNYIAVSAPGADIFLPAPDGQYQITSGTSFSAAYISGVAALILERNPALKAAEVKLILTKTARDLGPPGPDDQFGAGEADAFAAVSAVPVPVLAAAPDKPAQAELSAKSDASMAQTEGRSPAEMAADKPNSGESPPK